MQHQDTLPAALRNSCTWLFALAVLLALAAAPAFAGQKKNDGANCPYCKGDAELMAKAKLVSHGGFEFGINDTAKIDAYLAAADIRWLESEHFQIGLALSPHKVKEEEKKKVRAELAKLAEVLPEVDTRTKILDPWLRLHLYAQRCE